MQQSYHQEPKKTQVYHLGSRDYPERYSCEVPVPTLNGLLSETDSNVNSSILYLSKEGVIRLIELEDIRLIRRVEKVKFFNSTFKNCYFSKEFCQNVTFDSCLFHECKFEYASIESIETIFSSCQILSSIVNPMVCSFRECTFDDTTFSEKDVSCTFSNNLWSNCVTKIKEIHNIFNIAITVYPTSLQIGSYEFEYGKNNDLIDYNFNLLTPIEKQVVQLYDNIIRTVVFSHTGVGLSKPLTEYV